jgi:hypothetical protein
MTRELIFLPAVSQDLIEGRLIMRSSPQNKEAHASRSFRGKIMRVGLKRCCDQHGGVAEHVHFRPNAAFIRSSSRSSRVSWIQSAPGCSSWPVKTSNPSCFCRAEGLSLTELARV